MAAFGKLGILVLTALLLGACDQPPGAGGKPNPEAKSATPASAAKEASKPSAEQDWRAVATVAADRGVEFLLASSKDGKWAPVPGKDADLGVSALAATAVLARRAGEAGRNATRGTLEWLVASQKPDGGIYDKAVAVYVTSMSVLALKGAAEPKYDPILAKAVEYLRVVQTDEGDQRERSSEDYGGIGYGGKGDVNLSTTHFAIEAASAAGLAKDDAFYKKALVFLERCQNRSESNPLTHPQADGTKVESGNDGGAFYRPAESKAGIATLPDGRKVFRSYGSMTYALLKSYLLCDLDAKDPRVKAALEWIAKNWELESNPGLDDPAKPEAKYQGLFYYYLTLARCLGAAERQQVDLGAVGLGSWREQLVSALVKRQASDGSWSNPADRWMEGSPSLVTGYVVLALNECLGAK